MQGALEMTRSRKILLPPRKKGEHMYIISHVSSRKPRRKWSPWSCVSALLCRSISFFQGQRLVVLWIKIRYTGRASSSHASMASYGGQGARVCRNNPAQGCRACCLAAQRVFVSTCAFVPAKQINGHAHTPSLAKTPSRSSMEGWTKKTSFWCDASGTYPFRKRVAMANGFGPCI
jgi:hypothetical protein